MTAPPAKPTFKVLVMGLTHKDVEKMRHMEHARPLVPRQVAHLFKVLEAGEQLDGVVTLNDMTDGRGKRFRVIDGNHRWQAITEFLEAHHGAHVQVTAHIYDHLTDIEERERFLACSNAPPVKMRDRLRLFQDYIPICGMIKRAFPCSVGFDAKGNLTYMGLFIAYRARVLVGGPVRADIIDYAKGLTEADYQSMGQFIGDLRTLFGQPGVGNLWYGSTGLPAMAKVYFSNVDRIGRAELLTIIGRRVISDPLVVQAMRMSRGGASASEVATILVTAANRGIENPARRLILPADREDRPVHGSHTKVRMTEGVIHQIQQEHAAGTPTKDIATKFGIRPTRVRYWTDPERRRRQRAQAHARDMARAPP